MARRRQLSPVRRRLLRNLTAGAGIVGLAGCTDAIDGGGPGDDASDSSDDPTADAEDSEDHGDSDDANDGDSDDDTDDTAADVHDEYDTTTVRVTTSDGDELGEVTAAIADTADLQALGLSETDELPEDRGMLFVYETVDDRTFGMPEMSFGIDIIFADDDGTITGVHNAPEPGPDEDGSEQHYPGRGQYVLEVVYEWTTERGVGADDVLEFDL